MNLNQLLWLAHGMELKDAIDAIACDEWSTPEQFRDIVDIETSVLQTSILADDTFHDYSDSEIQAAINEAICEYIDDEYYKHA